MYTFRSFGLCLIFSIQTSTVCYAQFGGGQTLGGGIVGGAFSYSDALKGFLIEAGPVIGKTIATLSEIKCEIVSKSATRSCKITQGPSVGGVD